MPMLKYEIKIEKIEYEMTNEEYLMGTNWNGVKSSIYKLMMHIKNIGLNNVKKIMIDIEFLNLNKEYRIVGDNNLIFIQKDKEIEEYKYLALEKEKECKIKLKVYYQDVLMNWYFQTIDIIYNTNKENNNLYKLSKTIFRDFYNSNSEKWNICKINDIGLYISDYVANGSFKSLAQNVKIYDNKNYALFIRNTDLKVNFTQGRKYVDEHSYNFLSKSKLYGRELIISNVGDVGSIFLCPSFEIPMTLGNNVIMIDSKETKVNYNYYLYYFFLSAEGQYLIDGITGGSAQPKFNKTDFKNSLIKLPSKEDILEFNDKIIPMYDIIEKNIKENDILEQLRDTLLPKLMNGEIDLDKVEI